MGQQRHARPLYGVYAKIPAPLRRLIAEMIPAKNRAHVRYWARGEAELIAAELKLLDGTPWNDFRSGLVTSGTTERVVEYPWAISRYAGEQHVLDIGTANAIDAYVDALRKLGVHDLHGLDLSPRLIEGIQMTQADVRQMPFSDSFFDLVFCVSTLEHIGRDNATYGIRGGVEMEGDERALLELGRVLRRDGRLIVTVPFGSARNYEWFRQYDRASWQSLVTKVGLTSSETALFTYESSGWHPAHDVRTAESSDYRGRGAQGAAAVLCAVLHRS